MRTLVNKIETNYIYFDIHKYIFIFLKFVNELFYKTDDEEQLLNYQKITYTCICVLSLCSWTATANDLRSRDYIWLIGYLLLALKSNKNIK